MTPLSDCLMANAPDGMSPWDVSTGLSVVVLSNEMDPIGVPSSLVMTSDVIGIGMSPDDVATESLPSMWSIPIDL